jgi:molybdate transport system regulatory protein
MKTSARNELNGTIIDIQSGGVMSEVGVKVSDNVYISATITNHSKDALELAIGENVTLLIKSSLVILSKEKLRTTARNNIKTEVKEVIKGAVNSEVKLLIGEKSLCAIVTNDAISDLQIGAGNEVYAIFKASSVILIA